MNSESDNLPEPPNAVSDDQLDQWLQLARPELIPHLQHRLRRSVTRILRGRSDTRANLGLVSMPTLPWVVGAMTTACLAVVVYWAVSDRHGDNSPTISSHESKAIGADGDATSNSIAVLLPDASPKGVAAKERPPIISRVVYWKPNDQAKRRTVLRRSRIALRWREFLLARTSDQLNYATIQLADSPLGLKLFEQSVCQFDQAMAHFMESNGRGRPPQQATVIRGSNRLSNLAEAKRQWLIFRKVRGQLNSYLVSNIRGASPTLATASFRLLCRSGSPQALPAILAQWNRTQLRTDMVVAARRWADSKVVADLILSTSDSQLQTRLMTELLNRGDALSVDLALTLTAKHGLYAVAQASGANSKPTPTSVLLERLNSNRLSIARAAAITLSLCADPMITEQLIQACEIPTYRQSAWMALTVRRDAKAQRFVRRLAQDVRWTGTIAATQKQWHRQVAMTELLN